MSATTVNTTTEKPKYALKDSFRHWWNKSNLKEAEHNVLSLLPFYPESDGKRVSQIFDVDIGSNNKIHEFNIKNITPTDNKEQHVVLIHGYGAALGFFYKNFDGLTQRPGVNLHALDLLGYGLSSRPKLPHFKKVSKEDTLKVEDFFIESVEEWRKARNIDKFLLVGHSLGGYLSSLYALKYPEHVDQLVLVSPVGVERSIYDLSSSANSNSTRSNEELVEGPDIEQEVGAHHHDTDSPVHQTKKSSSVHVPDANGYVARIPNYPKYLVYFWENNFSPFSFIRLLGPIGPTMTSRWSFRRFGHLENYSEIMKLHVYSYNTFVAKGSGEYALTRILAPGALARLPLLSRLPQGLKVNSLWLYGDVDWMSKEAGSTIVGQINSHGKVKAEYQVLKNAGHHVYLDNPEDFKDSIFKFFGW
ncbi:hypothetical protein WICMUC_003262 [Wickerhamomyces mucosus]|uniref:AB hydrolase-1 domain-containing protein n=1 Tax=Wickerhamomyces mucosus TaxID=1378264 RepID=A0A9P8PMV4_9ASCO|nr:hypothetical protein WICMUC_003262 [Wickerhamomyces mucosus]